MDNAVRCQQWEPCTNCPSSTLLRVTANPGGNVCASFIQKFSRCCLTLFWLLYMASFDGEHLYVMPLFFFFLDPCLTQQPLQTGVSPSGSLIPSCYL